MDIRVLALLCVIFGIFGAIFLPLHPAVLLAAGIDVVGVVLAGMALFLIPTDDAVNVGVAMVVLGLAVCLTVPAWLVLLSRALL
jgi:hypothetical protein